MLLLSALTTLALGFNLVRGDNINGWTGCSPDQKGIVTQAYKDALRLADHVDPFKGHDELFAPASPNDTADASKLPDELSLRFFGQQTQEGSDQAKYVGCTCSDFLSSICFSVSLT